MSLQVHFDYSRSYRGGDSPSAEMGVHVLDAADLPSAVLALQAVAPATYCNLVLVGHELSESAQKPQTRFSGNLLYGEWKRPETGEYEYEFRTSGGTQKINYSKQTVASYARPNETAPNTGNLIEEGADIHYPIFEWSETWYIAHSLMSDAYIRSLCDNTAKTNSAGFKRTPWSTELIPAGEVLFLGTEGKVRVKTVDWAVSFHFAVSKPGTNIVVGPITIANKKGWDYAWVHRVQVTKGTPPGKTWMVEEAAYAKVERVYDSVNFADLFPPNYRT